MMKLSLQAINVCALLGASVFFTGNSLAEQQKINDGPYIEKQALNYQVTCINNSQLMNLTLKASQLPADIANCNYPVNFSHSDVNVQNILSYQGDFPVVAVSDFHGQYDLMKTLLTNNKVIDEQGNWSWGKGHFVITGDVFDRGDKVTEILWFLYQLEQQAEKSGGKVHLLLGNHEVMVLNGDLRYLHPKYVEVANLVEKPFEQLFSKDTVLGEWLRSKAVLVKINNMLFAHGGFHPVFAEKKVTLDKINTVFKQHLVEPELDKKREGFAKFLHKSGGPIWYRGYFKDDGATSQEIDLLLMHFDIDHLVVGHTSQKEVLTKHQGRVIAIDSSIKKGQYGELLLVDGDKHWRGTLSGEKIPLPKN